MRFGFITSLKNTYPKSNSIKQPWWANQKAIHIDLPFDIFNSMNVDVHKSTHPATLRNSSHCVPFAQVFLASCLWTLDRRFSRNASGFFWISSQLQLSLNLWKEHQACTSKQFKTNWMRKHRTQASKYFLGGRGGQVNPHTAANQLRIIFAFLPVILGWILLWLWFCPAIWFMCDSA